MKNRLIRTNSDNWNKVNQSEYNDSVVFIEDTKQIYTNQILYNGSITAEDADNLYPDSIEEQIYLTKGPQILTNTEKSQVLTNINAQEILVSGNNIKTINGESILGNGDIISGGGTITETDPIFSASPAAGITNNDISNWDGKQDTINDLSAIRAGALLGVTALQSVPSEYITETELNGKGYLTQHQDISGKQDVLVSGTNIKTINGTSLLGSGNITVATQTYVDSKIGDINTILETIING